MLRWSRMRAFTLIELLIVVAIIAILAAIAAPNFLEAQTRSKVARVKADIRSVATGLEAYRVDYNAYPPVSGGYAGLYLGVYDPTHHACGVHNIRGSPRSLPAQLGRSPTVWIRYPARRLERKL